ncbi:hypothetical protein [Streptosporangium sp. NPDC049376]|uniref:hypothetical protein n=1 Tax=Streptosporangium sp. NPDC049376 TaxID=3366192 RepID=UPI0037BAF940
MNAKVLAFIGLLLAGSGVLAGMMPVTSEGEECGSAFFETDVFDSITSGDEPSRDIGYRSGCTDTRSLVRIPSTVLIVAGGATLIAASLSTRKTDPEGE